VYQFVVGEVEGHVFLDQPQIGWRGGPERSPARRGDRREGGAFVVRIGLAGDEGAARHVVDHPADSGAAEDDPVAEITHRQPTVGYGLELEQDVVGRQRESVTGPQPSVHQRDEPRVHPEHASPRVCSQMSSRSSHGPSLAICVQAHTMYDACVRT